MTAFIDQLPPIGSDPLEVIDAFASWVADQGRPMYPHQEEAALALGEGQHVVLATPTGSGKSTVAMLGIALARNRRERSVWTAPIKALVAEKFFDLVDLFGASEVGLAIGDASINREGPILVCTAEVLANQALAIGDAGGFGFACLDEFHYYTEADRGWAWQVPLLCLKKTQFLLASATLGDISAIITDLETRTVRSVANVTSVKRPTPLYHQWRQTTVADSITEAVKEGLSPVYLVHGSQADAIERAQSLTSLPLTTRPQREAIAEALKGERLNTGFGQSLGRFLRNGVGVHHAGMLPRYRRLVERLAGEGLLPVICGTDTLGVGVNIPIRTVLLSALTKYDGNKVRTLRAREFHQLSGRAGRPGFDPDGHVWAQAPDHVIDNERALAKAGDDPKARRKVKRAEPPKGFVHYDEATFQRLIAAAPEPLVSRFRVTPNLVASVLSRPDGVDVLKDLLATNHDSTDRKRAHKLRAIEVYRSLEAAGVAQRQRAADGTCQGVQIGSLIEGGGDERMELRFTGPLGPFAIEVISTLDREDPTYVLDVVSVIESVIENPMAILIAQEKAARATEIGRLKSEGVGYEERLELLDGITWSKPLGDVLAACFETYQANHPWMHERPEPKGILREMLESGETFAGFVNRYKIERSEGLLLRYLSDVWRSLDRSLSSDAYTDALEDVIEWLAGLLRAVDASLLEEWERLSGVDPVQREQKAGPAMSGPPKAWKTAMRTAAFGWVDVLARKGFAVLAERTGWSQLQLIDIMRAYWSTYGTISTDSDARSAKYFSITEEADRWVLRQRLVDPEGDAAWGFTAHINLAEAMEAGAPTLVLESIGPFGEEATKA